jgi:SAM-dependent methyltransferase
VNCRICGSPTEEIFSLGRIPLVNNLLDSPNQPYDSYPLDVMFCPTCHLGQIKEIVPPQEMFEDYVYYSSVSQPIVDSAKALADKLAWNVPSGGLVMEIGSNDGYLLQFYKEKGIRVLGIDPARGPAREAALKGIPTIPEYFTSALAKTLPHVDILHANNVVAHIPDLHDLAEGIFTVLKPDGICVIEVHYLKSLLESCAFDTVYHEHCYYFSLRSLETLFRQHGLFIGELKLLDSQGGSLRLTLRKTGASCDIIENLPLVGIQQRIDRTAGELRAYLEKLHHDGARVWGFGAAAKATVMMNYCGITSALVEAVADPTPAKLGKFIPGTGVEIVHPTEWLDAQPDYTCIFAWNYAHIIENRYAKDYKGKFFTPYAIPAMGISA